jgi:hypothetical protein
MNERSSPLQNPLLFGIGGLIIGLLIGWLLVGAVFLSPFVRIVDTDPWDLNPAAKQEWVTMVADTYGLNQDLNAARERLRGYTNEEISQALTAGIVQRNTVGDATGAARLQAFGQVYGLDLGTGPTPAPTPSQGGGRTGGLFDNLGSLLLLLAGLILLVALGLFLYMRFRGGSRSAPAAATNTAEVASSTSAESSQLASSQSGGLEEQPITAAPVQAQSQTPARAPAGTKSLGTFAATYKFGEDNYDTSFTLETARGEFLGETGMGSSETIGDGKPDKVTAFDVWLFDKTDVRTVTQILMSEAAFGDQATRQRLATKGELVLAEKGKHILLDTATLTVDAEIKDLVYASTPGLSPNSHFQKLIVEMVPGQK